MGLWSLGRAMAEQSTYRRLIGIYAKDATATATGVVIALVAFFGIPVGPIEVRLLLALAVVGTLLNLFELHAPEERTRGFTVAWVLAGGALTVALFVVGFLLAAPFVEAVYAGLASFLVTSIGQYVAVVSTKPIWGDEEEEEDAERPGSELPTQGRGGRR